MKIKDLSIDEFKSLIRETVEDTLQDLLLDPDAGKSLKEAFEQELLHIREQRQLGETQTISSDKAMEELGLS
jgi:hypothetical protein